EPGFHEKPLLSFRGLLHLRSGRTIHPAELLTRLAELLTCPRQSRPTHLHQSPQTRPQLPVPPRQPTRAMLVTVSPRVRPARAPRPPQRRAAVFSGQRSAARSRQQPRQRLTVRRIPKATCEVE